MTARQAALFVLKSVLNENSYLNLALKKILSDNMPPEEKRFATALSAATIENLFRIDYVIGQFTSKSRIQSVVRNILRLGVCQLMFFESVPASAAVNESVKLTEKCGKRQLKGFVNATLRSISSNLGTIRYPDRNSDLAEFLHIFYSYPKWLCEKYIGDYGQAQAEEIISYKTDNAYTCVRYNKIKGYADLSGMEPGKYLKDAYYIKNSGAIEKMPLFRQGHVTVQGEASMVCVLAAGIQPQDNVLDACAAPGGKSAYAAQIAKDGHVTALDVHAHRKELILETFGRLGVVNGRAYVEDATVFNPTYEEKFDVVLLDAPCSALGLLYRKPDIKLKKTPEDIEALVKMQRKLLLNCARYVAAGGTLLYSTCTVNRQENEENAQWILQQAAALKPAEIKNDIPEGLMARANGHTMQLFPNIDGIDGFFMAKFVKDA